MDSDFDIDEGDEPDSDQEEDAPKRKSRVVTKAYKVELEEAAEFYPQAKKKRLKCNSTIVFHSFHLPQEPIKVVKPKPKRPSEEQKKTEKAKVELKRRIPQEFQDFAESKISAKSDCHRKSKFKWSVV